MTWFCLGYEARCSEARIGVSLLFWNRICRPALSRYSVAAVATLVHDFFRRLRIILSKPGDRQIC